MLLFVSEKNSTCNVHVFEPQWLYERCFHGVLPKEIIFSVVSPAIDLFNREQRDALVTTKPDGLAASRRASHCSSYVALNLLSSLQMLRAVPSRHVSVCWRLRFTFSTWAIAGVCVTLSIYNTHASVTISLARIKKETPPPSLSIIRTVISKIYKYSVI